MDAKSIYFEVTLFYLSDTKRILHFRCQYTEMNNNNKHIISARYLVNHYYRSLYRPIKMKICIPSSMITTFNILNY